MKRVNKILILILSALFGFSASEAFPANSSENYTVRYLLRQQVSGPPTSLTAAQAMQTVTYYDGLGRPLQTIEVAASPQNRDIITPVEYDAFGRGDAKVHLPYMSTTSDGSYHATALAEKTSFYSGKFGSADAARAFTENVYENSPLNRVVQQKKPGAVYTGRPATSAYGSNAANEVLKITVNTSHDFVVSAHYPAGTLFKNSVTNEDGLIVTTFTDKLDRTLLERSAGDGTTLDTYYVYDDFNQLCWVISPEGAHSLVNGTYAPAHPTALNYCYMYKYDSRGRVIEKRLPGAESVEMIYDQADRLIASRDGKGKAEGYWILNQYDAFDRLTEQRRVNSSLAPGSITGSFTSLWNAGTLLLRNTYDKYEGTGPAKQTSISGITVSIDDTPSQMKGLKTAEEVAVLGGSGIQMINRRFYYDSKGRLTQTVETNIQGGTSCYTTQYDFIGNAVSTHESHTVNGTTHTVLTTNSYDHRNRLLSSTTTLNNGSPATVAYTYDDLGMLQTKTPGPLTPTTYTYNIQGWQTGQTSDRFTMALDYFGAGKYAGNITQWSWGHGSAVDQHYAFTYNKFDWMTSGVHSSEQFKERILEYDRNGNAKDYIRTWEGFDFRSIFTYDGNRLIGQNENGAGVRSNSFDANGSMTHHGFRDLVFEYNCLNLPSRVSTGSGTLLSYYLYDALGRKLQNRIQSGLSGYDYVGRIRLIWSNGSLTAAEVNFGEGVVRNNGEIRFFEKDHLGSVRVVLTDRGDVVERNDYMPFGLRHSGGQLDAGNDYHFNGKESQNLIGADHLDYGARIYRADQAPSWYAMDPLAEKYYSISPYAYTLNNPVKFVDPDGREVSIATLSATHQESLQTFLNTPTGYSFVSRYMNGGSVLWVNNFPYIFVTSGDRAKDLLSIQTSSSLPNDVAGTAQVIIKGSKGRLIEEVTPSDVGNVLQYGVQETIGLNDDLGAKEAVGVLGHEAFVHADRDADALTGLDRKQTVSTTERKREILANDVGNTAIKDHKALGNGEIIKFGQFMQEATKNTGDSYYEREYKRQVEDYKNRQYY